MHLGLKVHLAIRNVVEIVRALRKPARSEELIPSAFSGGVNVYSKLERYIRVVAT